MLTATAPTIAVDVPATEIQLSRRDGEVRITRDADNTYTAEILLDASVEEVWNVIADYDNFSDFLPNIVSSDVLEVEGNRHVVEQVSERRIFFLNVRSRIRTENLETKNQRIDFRLVEGDLARLEGSWILESVAESNHLRLKQTVNVSPEDGTPETLFYDIFEQSLADTLEAIREEVLRRRG
ncbi:SRPBCC family protein [Baaleninema simplex]|uniref:SRPBCC family protein n=1 Tax=Baaleninema simplex TaxID=2862350 RepID=UPI00130EC342|nr:SRPBCC family protein [Baaleninema simplex]